MASKEEQQPESPMKEDFEDDNKTNKICCNLLIPYENWEGNKFIPYDPKDPRGTPFPPGRLPCSSHATVSDDRNTISITFQQGPKLHCGDNGTYPDALIAVARDMLTFVNSAPQLRCREYSIAITKMEEALGILATRAARLQAGGTYGTGGGQSPPKRQKN